MTQQRTFPENVRRDTSPERELAQSIADYMDDTQGQRPARQDVELAAAILAAGYVKPRTITTLEELEDLPSGSVILDPTGLSLHKNEFTGWRASNGARNIAADMLEGEALPATVLHEPVKP